MAEILGRNQAFSLIELLTVVAIIGVFGSYSDSTVRYVSNARFRGHA